MVEFVQLTTECCWGQPSDPCQRGCLTSHACVMWGPRTLNADDDDDDDDTEFLKACMDKLDPERFFDVVDGVTRGHSLKLFKRKVS